MSTIGHNSDAIRAFVERIERMEAEKAGIASDIKDIFAELKGQGYDAAAIRQIVKLRKEDAGKRAEREAILELYKEALGMLADLPLGQAYLEKSRAA
jgi:uncharacterized protein (UPF0335 family)